MTGKITRSLMSSSGSKTTSTIFPIRAAGRGSATLRNRGEAGGRIDVTLPSAAIEPATKGQGRDMSFADGAQAQDEAKPAFRRAGLIGMRDDARIEQGRGLEGIFVQEIRADQLALHLGEIGMGGEGVFHFVGARLERRQQVAVAALEILQNFGQQIARPSRDRAPGRARRCGSPASCRSG